MGGSAGSFMEGLAGGIQQGQRQSMAKQLNDVQMQHLKTSNKAAELALTMEQMKHDVFGKLTPEQQMAALFPKADDSLESKLNTIQKFFQGGQTAPLPDYVPGSGTGPTRPRAMSVPDMVAQGQVGELGVSREDILQGVLKKELGVERSKFNRFAELAGPGGLPWVVPMDDRGGFDWTKAYPKAIRPEMQKGVGEGMAPTETPVNPYNRGSLGAPIQTGPPPTMQVETPTAGGGKVRGVVPLFPGGSKVTGTTGGGVRTELDLLDVPISSSDITKWSDGKGNNPPMGWTPRQAQSRGFKQTQEGMAAESGGKAVMVAQALQDIEAAEKMFFPRPGVFNRSLAISSQMGLPEWMAEGSQTAVSMMMNAASAKLRIETGATARPEEQKDVIARFVPSWKDNDKSARGKMARFKEFMRAGKFILDPKGRIVVVEPPKETKKPDLSLGKKKDPSSMTDAELLKALQ